MLELIVVVGGLAVFAVIGGTAVWYESRRRKAITVFADSLGLEVASKLPSADESRFFFFDLAKRGQQQKTKLALIADDGTTRIVLFERQITNGKNTHSHTIAMSYDARLAAPPMQLQRASWSTKLTGIIGVKPIRFPDDPEFQARFAVRGRPELEIREFLHEKRRAALFNFVPPFENLSLSGKAIMIAYPGRIRVDQIKSQLQTALQLNRLMIANGSND